VSDGASTIGGTRTTITTSGGLIAALEARPTDAPAVLLLPGYTGSKEDFADVLDPIAAAGFSAMAIDLPGQFESPGPADPVWYTPGELARVVIEVAAELGAPVHLVGHSFGGLVARAAVTAAPDCWSSLVLLCSGPAGIEGDRRDMIEALAPLLATSGLAAVFAASRELYRQRPGYVEPTPAAAAFLERRFITGVPAMLQGMGESLRTEPDRVAELAAAAVPKLVMHGVDDDAWPPAVQLDMARRLGVDRVIIPNAAHSPAAENPNDTTAALVEFWRGV
jgi:pimeloyl-ACP methyl ester carboxylesterase